MIGVTSDDVGSQRALSRTDSEGKLNSGEVDKWGFVDPGVAFDGQVTSAMLCVTSEDAAM